MTTLSQLFAGLLAAARKAGHEIPLDDAEVAQLVADALDIVQPDDEETADAAPYLANTFWMLAEDLRAEDAEYQADLRAFAGDGG